jgi:hypothetical protein
LEELSPLDRFAPLLDFAEEVFTDTDAAGGIVLPDGLCFAGRPHDRPEGSRLRQLDFHKNPHDQVDFSPIVPEKQPIRMSARIFRVSPWTPPTIRTNVKIYVVIRT